MEGEGTSSFTGGDWAESEIVFPLSLWAVEEENDSSHQNPWLLGSLSHAIVRVYVCTSTYVGSTGQDKISPFLIVRPRSVSRTHVTTLQHKTKHAVLMLWITAAGSWNVCIGRCFLDVDVYI